MTAACGLDFGTSNTTLGLATASLPQMTALDEGETTLPSALFFDFEAHRRLFGQAAIQAYVSGTDGRFMRGLKSVLGTSLIDEETELGAGRIGFRDLIAIFIGEVKRRGEAASGRSLTHVVHGRPVHFVDGDEEGDRRAESALREIAQAVGFKEISFQLEPIAAALDYEASAVVDEELAIVADIGGGTSDFTVIRLSPVRRELPDRTSDVLASTGVRMGGTDVDRHLSLEAIMPHLGYRSPMRRPGLKAPAQLFTDLATWSRVNLLYNRKVVNRVHELVRDSAAPHLLARLLKVLETRRGHTLAIESEQAKIQLTTNDRASIDLSWLEPGLQAAADRCLLETVTATMSERIGNSLRTCLSQAAISPDAINAVFLTGGSTLLPTVRAAILQYLPAARVVDGDRFGSVGQGLTLEALRRYGC
ncbi:hypothetical chaperone protein [Arboricoccus pini]|uniref:Hypothetical chaperone protein n=1 Tax=Arboricoccus pini TaxID=1963835 RepID=A0A212Q8L1_9PROT|nr:Hsp70 family protein [Arboricoccus pini]SNB55637.1 hypothetical chaperone protein [Arboricoccus pini]